MSDLVINLRRLGLDSFADEAAALEAENTALRAIPAAFVHALDRYERGEIGWRDVQPFLTALRDNTKSGGCQGCAALAAAEWIARAEVEQREYERLVDSGEIQTKPPAAEEKL